MDQKEELKKTTGDSRPLRRPDCIKCFDMLWFCYSPFHQLRCYYRVGEFDTCFSKWGDLIDCLALKTKSAREMDEILAERERNRSHIWSYRTVDEASGHWRLIYRHLAQLQGSFEAPPPKSSGGLFEEWQQMYRDMVRIRGSAGPPPKSGGGS